MTFGWNKSTTNDVIAYDYRQPNSKKGYGAVCLWMAPVPVEYLGSYWASDAISHLLFLLHFLTPSGVDPDSATGSFCRQPAQMEWVRSDGSVDCCCKAQFVKMCAILTPNSFEKVSNAKSSPDYNVWCIGNIVGTEALWNIYLALLKRAG